VKRIGVIADTHGTLDLQARVIFDGVDLILHAGDIGSIEVIRDLERIAPVVAVSGNHEDEETAVLPWLETVTVDGVKIALTHRFFPLNMENTVPMPAGWQKIMGVDGVRAMVFGHSHEPVCAQSPGMLYYCPGYAGPDMTEPVRTAGLLFLDGNNITARTYFLSPPPREEYFSKAQLFGGIVENIKNNGDYLKK